MSGSISFGGIISGLDTNAIIDALMAARRQPITTLERKAELIFFEKTAFQRVNSLILNLQKATLSLRYESTFKRKSVTSSNEALLSATSGYDALNRSYAIEVDQVARGARAISGLNNRTLDRSAALLMSGNTAGITGLTADSTDLGATRATMTSLITDTLQAGEGSAAVTAGDTIGVAGILKDGVTNVSGTFTFASDGTDTIQRLAQTIQATFQGEVTVSLGRNGELILTESDPTVSGNITFSSLNFSDTDYSGSTLGVGIGNSYAGGAAVANVITGTKTFTTGSSATIATSATLIQNLDQVSGVLDTGLDKIEVTGTDFDGTDISGTYTFTAADTLNELLTYVNSLYTGATASIQNGKIVLTDSATGSSQTTLDLAFVDDSTTYNTFDAGIFLTAIQGIASTAQTIHTDEFTTPAIGKHILTTTDGKAGQVTGTVNLDPDTLLTTLGVTEPHLFTIDTDSGANGVAPSPVRGLTIWSTVQDLVEAVNTQVPGVTAGLIPDGSGQYYMQITSNTGGTDIRLTDNSANGILENVLSPTGGVDTDYTTSNATTDDTDFTMASRFQPSNNGGEQRFIYTGTEGTGVSTLIGNFEINGGATDVYDAGVAIVYTVENSELNLAPATDSYIIGNSGISDPLNTTHPPLNIYLSLAEAGFSVTPENEEDNAYWHTDGVFTINGVQITINDVDTVSVLDVIGLINSAGAGVIAEYDATADRFILRRNNPGDTTSISLGGAGDTSNFLTIAGLIGTTGATSFVGTEAGSIDLDTTLSFARFTLPPSAGTFTINGVTLYVDPAGETLRDLITKINNSAAGVEASYDTTQDRIVLSQKLTDNPTFDQITIGALSDTSNVLSSFRLTNSTISTTAIGTVREDARFSVNGLDYIRSTNTIDDVINDVEFTINGVTSTTPISLTVAQDPDPGVEAVTDFIVAYNTLVAGINPTPLGSDERDTMQPLSDYEAASMRDDEILEYEATRSELVQRNFIFTSGVIRRLNTGIQASIFDPVEGISSGNINLLSSLGINTGSIGSTAGFAKQIPYLVEDSTDWDAIHDAVENSTYVKSYILSKADEVFDLFSKKMDSSVSVLGDFDITGGVSLSSRLSFSIDDGDNYAQIVFEPGFHTQSMILSEINGALNVAGMITTHRASVSAQGHLEIEAESESGRARIHIVDLNTGAQLDDSIGLPSGNYLGEFARLNAGLARRVDFDLENFTGYDGFISQRIRFGGILDRRLLDIAEDIADLEDRLEDYELSLRRQYAYMEQALSRYQTTSSFIAQQTAYLSSGGSSTMSY